MNAIKFHYHRLFRPYGLYAFLSTLPADASILDVGCGNDSSYNIKTRFPRFRYTGIDVGNYNVTKPMLADAYVLTSADRFAQEIAAMVGRFDAVVSSHNLEHCNDRDATLRAMLNALSPGGRIYLSFPCEASVGFPSRRQTLNYFDDPTHQRDPPVFNDVVSTLQDHGLVLERRIPRYRPFVLWALGALQEPLSRRLGRNLQGTWAYYGFESIIWARKGCAS